MNKAEILAAMAIAYAESLAAWKLHPDTVTPTEAMMYHEGFLMGANWSIDRSKARLEARIKAMQEEG